MNKTYRLIWNAILDAWVAVAEIVKARGQGHDQCRGGVVRAGFAIKPLALALMGAGLSQAAPPATELPTSGRVVAGQAAIAQNGATMNVSQTTARTAIDWQTFNVGSSATVNFLQPSSSAVVLNRVLTGNPSQIFGQINANGQVFLTNPGGIYFAPGSSANVGALVATTHDISNADFMAGNYRFSRNGATGSVTNEGELKADLGGYIALLAPEVRNQGVIVAQLGKVALAAGEVVTLKMSSSNTLADIEVTQSAIAALVENGNAVQAPGGMVILSAQAADRLQGGVVRNTGSIEATGLVDRGGVIRLEGDHITLASGSKLDASGATGGGEVLVGGNWQGGGGMHQATTVTMEQGATIDVSATKVGDGGTAVLWSDVSKPNSVTTVRGTILAKGGAEGGNGGRIETSGHVADIGGASVSAAAPKGIGGLWLIDPTDATIDQTAANSYATTLNTGTSVLNEVTGDITWNSGVTLLKNNGGDATLTLKATGSIVFQANGSSTDSIKSTSGKLNTVLWSDSDSSDAGSIFLTGYNNIITNGGGIWMGGGAASGTANWTPYSGATALTVGTGYAVGVNVLNGARFRAGIEANGTGTASNLTTSGGNIALYGKSYDSATNGTNGVVWDAGTLDAGSGTILIDGVARASAGNAQAVSLANGTVNIKSSSSDADAIKITGDASSVTGAGVSIGINLPNGTLQATGGGGITLLGKGGSASGYSTGFQMNAVNILANSGAISLSGVSAGTTGMLFSFAAGSGFTIGQKAGTDVTSSTSNILWKGDRHSLGGSDLFSSSGTLTIENYTAGTTIGIAGGTGTLALAATDISSRIANGFSKITIGSATAGDINIGTTALTYNDPLTLKTAGNIVQASGSSITGGAGSNALILWADADVNNGRIKLDGSINTNSGNLVMAGGADDGSNGGTSSDGIPDGYAKGYAGNVIGVELGTAASSFATGGGNLVLRGQGHTGGIGVSNYAALSTGSGSFTVTGSSDTYGVFFGTTGKLTTTSGNVTISGTSTASMGVMLQGDGTNGTDTITTGTGTISVTGSGSAATYGGIYVENARLISSSGAVTLDGTNANASGWGIKLDGAHATLGYRSGGSSSSNLLLKADSININAGRLASSGTLTIEPKTSNTAVAIGGAVSANTFTLSATNFSTHFINGFSNITIGSSTAGAITVGGATTFLDSTTLKSNSTIAINGALTADENLILKAGGDILFSNNLSLTGNSATLNLFYGNSNESTAPTAGSSYQLALANRSHITLSGSTPTLRIGNELYTVFNSVAGLQSMGTATTTRAAIGQDLSLSGTTYTTAFLNNTYSGVLDGLGNTLDGLTIRNSTGGNLGLFAQLKGATVRNLGVSNIDIQVTSTNSANNYRIGGLAGLVSGSATSEITTLTGVWSSGLISTAASASQGYLFAGGLVGQQNSGRMDITRSYSAANVSGQQSTSLGYCLGGLIGDLSATDSSVTSTAGVTNVSRSYATGSVVSGTKTGGFYGTGAFIGLGYFSTGTVNVSDSYSWGNASTDGSVSFGGLIGWTNGGSYSNFYTKQTDLGTISGGSVSNAYTASTLNTQSGTVLPSGFSASTWRVGTSPTLVDLPIPPSIIYVKLTDGSGNYGSATQNYTSFQLVDGSGTTISLGSGSYTGLTGTTGTLRTSISIGGQTAAGTYRLSYLGGLAMTGSNSGEFILNPYSTPATYTVAKAALGVTGTTVSNKFYDGSTAATLSNGVLSGTIYNSDVVTLSQSGTFASKNVGTGISVTATDTLGGSGSGNYVLTQPTGLTANITQRPITVTAANQSRAYGSANPTSGSVTVTAGSVASGDVLSTASVSSDATSTTNAGATAALTPSNQTFSTGTAGNYAITYANGTLTINPKALTLTASNASKTYGETKTFAGTEFTPSGLVNNETVGSVTLTSAGSSATASVAGGPYSIVPSAATGGTFSAGNYTITYANGSLTINPKALTLTASNASKTYGETKTFAGTEFTPSGLVNGETVGSVTLTSAGSSATASLAGGPYSIVPSAATGGSFNAGNYSITYANGSLTINKAHLTVTADNQTRLYGQSNPSFTQTLSGFVNGETLATSGVSGSATGSSTATVSTPPGSATVLASAFGLSALNYDFPNLVNGTLTITAPADPPPPPPPPPDALPPPVTTPPLNLVSPLPETPAAGSGGGGGSLGVPANVGGSVSVSLVRPPSLQETGVVTVTVPREMAMAGVGFSFPLPTAVTESARPSAAISVTTLSGAPLPSWLRFVVDTRTFIASATPDGAFPMQVLVTIGGATTTVVISARGE